MGLTSLAIRDPPMLPKFNRRRRWVVLGKIDEIIAWEQRKEIEKDTNFVELGRYLCEVRAEQYWRLENLKSFDEFLENRFPGSGWNAYYLMFNHEHLPPQARKQLKEVGREKGIELAKLARRDRQHFDCVTWLHRRREMPKEQLKQEVEKELTGRETEPWEIIYLKLYQSQIPVIERAIETAALVLGSDRSRGYCLEMICADFLAGANLDNGERLAEQYMFGDRMVQTNQGPSFPAHQFIISGTSAHTATSDLFAAENPHIAGEGPAGYIAPAVETVALIDPWGSQSSTQYPCFEHATLTDLLDAKVISWRY